jgi:ABC-type antimicrobial peptide transport system permease subunit
VGLYGLVAFTVARRPREFGIRIALGAAASDLRRLVLVDTLWLVGVGIACGAPLGLGAALLMGPFLMSPPFDPVPLLGVPALLAVCAILAGHFPARRASRQDPAVVLRSE